MTYAVAHRIKLGVGSVLAEFQAMPPGIFVDLLTPCAEHRSDDLQIGSADPACRRLAHCAKTGRSGAAQQIQEKRFDQIVGMMPDKDCVATMTSRHRCEKLVARIAPGRLDRHFLFRRQGADIHGSHDEIAAKLDCNVVDEFRVGLTRAPSQPMVEMAQNEAGIAQLDELMQKRD